MGLVRVKLVAGELDLGSDSTNPSSVGIDDTAAHRDTYGQTELQRSSAAEPADVLTGTGIFAVLVKVSALLRERMQLPPNGDGIRIQS